MKKISSSQNEIFQSLKKLLTTKGIYKQNACFIWGEKFVQEILKSQPELILNFILPPGFDLNSSLLKAHESKCLELSLELFKELDPFGTHEYFAVCALPKITKLEVSDLQKLPHNQARLYLALNNPSNLGAVLRSSLAFGFQEVVLLKECASPFHPKATRASAGQVLKIHYYEGPSIHELSDLNLLALDMHGSDIRGFVNTKNPQLLIGEEGPGIPKDLKCQRVSIQMNSNVESLNAVVAASIGMYELMKLAP